MAKKKITWPILREFTHWTGKKQWIVDATLKAKRERRYFKTKELAEVWQLEKSVERQNHGTSGLNMPDKLRREALEQNERLALVGTTITEAVDFFFENAYPDGGQRTVQQVKPAIQARRGEILGALWSLVRNWDSRSRPTCSRNHGSFAAWSATIGGIVEAAQFGCCIGESKSARSGDIWLQQMIQLCDAALSDQPGSATLSLKKRKLTLEELVELAQVRGLFEEELQPDKDGELDRKCRSTFARMLKRYDCRVFNGKMKMLLSGSGHARKYVFERL